MKGNRWNRLGVYYLNDLRTGRSSLAPGQAGLLNPQWVGDDRLVAGTQDFTKLMVLMSGRSNGPN